jgi:hypothetical protein
MSILIQEMLEAFSTTAEAVEFITKAKLGGHAALLTIVDREGDMKTVEITPQHNAVRESQEGRVINTNHYQIAGMQRYEIPKDAVIADMSPMKGIRVHESSERRYERVRQLIHGSQSIDEARIISILRDHGADSSPSRNTVCMHGPISGTMRSMIFYPRRKIVKALHGSPCENEYSELAI